MATSRATYQTWLEAAETALHALMTTKTSQIVRYGEKEITYQIRDIPMLREYIKDLRKRAGCRQIIHVVPS